MKERKEFWIDFDSVFKIEADNSTEARNKVWKILEGLQELGLDLEYTQISCAERWDDEYWISEVE